MKCINCFVAAVVADRCSRCGFTQTEQHRDRRALAPGYVLANKYFIGRILGAGGFGISYLALDQTLNRRVALKEYLPNELVSRARDGVTIYCHSSADEEPYQRGLKRFFREGEMIAKFDHPNIVRAYEVLQANGTAYLAMEFLEGRTLRAILETQGAFPQKDAIDVMTFVMDALKVIHQKQVVHRDLKPDNVYMTNEGRTLLLDFGGAKEIVGERSHSMTAIFSHGYAAPEQYHGDEARSGPWTDVYGCGALLYKLITGQTPPSALERYSGNQTLDWRGAQVSPAIVHAVSEAMALNATARMQSVAALQSKLGAREQPAEPITTSKTGGGPALKVAVAGLLLSLAAGGVFLFTKLEPDQGAAPPVARPEVQAGQNKGQDANPAKPVEKPFEPSPAVVLPDPSMAAPKGLSSTPKPHEPAAAPVAKQGPSAPATAAAARLKLEHSTKAGESVRALELKAVAIEEAQRKKDEAAISAILEEGESCFATNRYDCAISSANAALRINQGDAKAYSLKERAVAGQKRALEGIRIQ